MPYRNIDGRYTRNRYAGFAGATYRTARRYGKKLVGAAAAGATAALVQRNLNDLSKSTAKSTKKVMKSLGMKTTAKYGAQTGRSAGKFSKRPKRNIFSKYTRQGFVTVQEWGSVITGANNSGPVFVGHATHADTWQQRTLFVYAMVREVFKRAGIFYDDVNAFSPGSFKVVVKYSIASSVQGNGAITEATAGKSMFTIMDNILNFALPTNAYDGINALVNSAIGQQEFFIDEILLCTDAAGENVLARVAMRDCNVEVFSKSDLKLQNRTVATGADEDVNSSENVANQPLYGKSYSGKGNGLVTKVSIQGSAEAKTLLCSHESGMLAYAPSGVSALRYFGEPPLPTLFSYAPKMTSARLEPGHIKTSSLAHTWKCKQTDFWRLVGKDAGTTVLSKGQIAETHIGKFRIFALEKIMTATSADTNPIVGAELQNRMGLILRFRRSSTCNEFQQVQQFITASGG